MPLFYFNYIIYFGYFYPPTCYFYCMPSNTASNVQIYTATHPIELADRLTPDWNPDSEEYFCRTYALPVKIGDGCWIGGGAIILPWVSIREGTVIAVGSVVTKSIPSNCVAVGNPCRVIKRINGENRFKSCYPHEKRPSILFCIE